MSRSLRFALAVLATAVGCSHTPPTSEGPARETTVTPPVAPRPEPSAWPAPELTRVADRASSTDTLTITLSGESLDGALEVRLARGDTAAACDGGRLAALEHAEDGTFTVHLEPIESATLCVRDDEHRVRATASTRGHRTIPFASARLVRGHVLLEQEVEPLDEDVTALVHVAVPEEGTLPLLGCRTEASAGPNDDPPEHCTYDCSGARVVAEIPRGVVDALLASPAYRAQTVDTDFLTPNTLGVRIPIEVSLGEELFTCARTRDGALVTSEMSAAPVHAGPWDGCDFDSVAGCVSDPLRRDPLTAGDILIGRTEDGAIVRAPIRRATLRRADTSMLELADGEHLILPIDALVLTTRGDVRVDALQPGDALVRSGGNVAITAVGEPSREEHTRVDLAGATYYLANGFAIRDAGGLETERAPWHAEPGFSAGGGSGDCAIAIAWRAASTTRDVSIVATPLAEPPWHTARATDCGAPRTTVDAAALLAVASLGESAEIVLTIDDPMACGTPHTITRCDAAEPLGEALSARASDACLPAGTLVDVPNGRISIEKLERGDVVEAFDPRRGLLRAQVIGETVHHDRALLRVVLDDGTELEATPEHVLLVGVDHRARTAGELRRGDVLSIRTDGALVERRIVSVTPSRRADVYELRVTSPDTYFANGILVHNY